MAANIVDVGDLLPQGRNGSHNKDRSQAIKGMPPGRACKKDLRGRHQFPDVWSSKDLSDGSPAHIPGIASALASHKGLRSKTPSQGG